MTERPIGPGVATTDAELPVVTWEGKDFQSGHALGFSRDQDRDFLDEQPSCHEVCWYPLVYRSDALAKIAEKDAEIMRYRDVISRIDGLIMGNNDPVKMFVAIHSACQSALKGSEA